ncbi:hypothetical protein BH10CYA1_BH10CYA1_45890 [soil metagenome]
MQPFPLPWHLIKASVKCIKGQVYRARNVFSLELYGAANIEEHNIAFVQCHVQSLDVWADC